MGDTFGQTDELFERSVSIALEGGFCHVVASGICHIRRSVRSQHFGVVPPLWDQSKDGLQMVGASSSGNRVVGSFASTASLAGKDVGPGGATGAGDASSSSGLGRTQAAQTPGGSGS